MLCTLQMCISNLRYWLLAASHSLVSTCEYSPKMDELSHNTASACVLNRDCVLLSFACALVHKIVKNLLEHHKRFTMAILYKEPATINLVDIQDSSRNLALIPPVINIYQIRIVMRFYGQTLKFTGVNEIPE